MSAQIIPFPVLKAHSRPQPRLEENPLSVLDPVYRAWCHQQNERAAELGQPLPHRSELRERWLCGERCLPVPEKLSTEQLITVLKERLGLQIIKTRGNRRDKERITPQSYMDVRDAVSALAEPFKGHQRAEDAIFRLVRQRFGCRVTELRERDVPAVMELLAKVEKVIAPLRGPQAACERDDCA